MDTPEMASVDAFAEYLIEDGRETFTFAEATVLATELKLSCPSSVIRGLKAYGFSMEERQPERRVRGFRTSNHDRFFGPGSAPMHGGSGWEQINGFAGEAR